MTPGKGRYPLSTGIDMVRYLLFKGDRRQAFLVGATIIGHRGDRGCQGAKRV
jgi:hypothetical protein